MPIPTTDLVDKSIKIWNETLYYNGPEQVLEYLFMAREDDYEHTFNKCFFLNAVYGTRLSRKDLEIISKFISKNEILNKYISDGNCKAVEQIAFESGTLKRNFSFATKYCSFSNSEQFPIYDNLVENILWEYQKEEHLDKYKRTDLKENLSKDNRYPLFKKKIDEFKSIFSLNCTYKELDRFLWMLGKTIQIQQKYENRFKVPIPEKLLFQLGNTEYLENLEEKLPNDIEIVEEAIRNNKPFSEELLKHNRFF